MHRTLLSPGTGGRPGWGASRRARTGSSSGSSSVRVRGRVRVRVEVEFEFEFEVDLLVDFEPEAHVGLLALGRLQRELTALFGRQVDLVPVLGLKPIVRAEVLATRELLVCGLIACTWTTLCRLARRCWRSSKERSRQAKPRADIPEHSHELDPAAARSPAPGPCQCLPRTNRAFSCRSISNGVMCCTRTPMHAFGILIALVEPAACSCVTTTCS